MQGRKDLLSFYSNALFFAFAQLGATSATTDSLLNPTMMLLKYLNTQWQLSIKKAKTKQCYSFALLNRRAGKWEPCGHSHLTFLKGVTQTLSESHQHLSTEMDLELLILHYTHETFFEIRHHAWDHSWDIAWWAAEDFMVSCRAGYHWNQGSK